MTAKTSAVEPIDREIIYRLQLDGRSSFRVMAQSLGLSEQTIARRYRRLVLDGVVRVRGQLNPIAPGYLEWLVRVVCRPSGAGAIADALATRPDAAWVSLTSGGTEVLCTIRARDQKQRDALLLERIPRSGQVVSLTAHSILHRFDDGSPGWTSYRTGRGDSVEASWNRPPAQAPRDEMDDMDLIIVSVLAGDGRATYTEIASVAGCTITQATARVERLRNSGALRIEVEVSPEPLGFFSVAYLWMSVAAGDLVSLGESLSAHEEVGFCAAVTGTVNMVAAVMCRDSADLYRYLTDRLATLGTVSRYEVSPVMRLIKQAGSLVSDQRLISAAQRSPGLS